MRRVSGKKTSRVGSGSLCPDFPPCNLELEMCNEVPEIERGHSNRRLVQIEQHYTIALNNRLLCVEIPMNENQRGLVGADKRRGSAGNRRRIIDSFGTKHTHRGNQFFQDLFLSLIAPWKLGQR